MPGSENAVSAIMSVAVRYVRREATSTPAGVSPTRSGATRPKNVALGIVSSANHVSRPLRCGHFQRGCASGPPSSCCGYCSVRLHIRQLGRVLRSASIVPPASSRMCALVIHNAN